MNLRLFTVILFCLAGLLSCASAPKKGNDRQCGRFCERITSCLADRYQDEMSETLCNLARCESGCREKVKAPAGYVGAFQFDQSTWRSVCGPIFEMKKMPKCKSVDARADLCCASECTAEMLNRGMSGRWPNCG